ncbi:MAG: DUF5320 domain-containing protein [Anaerolineales bacterium]|nr:DUF5320 domain-containing protein [Anaerolineales bacterium]
MPFNDGTGPKGQGPMTGWQQGNCNISQDQDTESSMFRGRRQGGRFWRLGRRGQGGFFQNRSTGFGRGFGWNAAVVLDEDSNLSDLGWLKSRETDLERNLSSIKKQISDLEKKD